MWRPGIHNRTFDWMGEGFAPLIDKEHFLGRSSIGNKKRTAPLANVLKKGDIFEIELAVPGFKKNELEVFVDDDILTIKGEKVQKNGLSDEKYILEEFDRHSFERRFRLGEGIGHEKIAAKYEDGILRLSFTDVPKAAEQTYQEIKVN